MLGVLLAKDLRRARRNPIAFLIHLAVPLLITGLIGLTFGGGGRSSGLGRIQLGIVDEDDSLLTQFLRGAVNQGEGGKYLQPSFLPRAEALRQIADNRLSAVVILPRGFTRDYLAGRGPITLELVKNPAQSFYPAIVEELLSALTTGLNAVARNFHPELAEWQTLIDRPARLTSREVTDLVAKTGTRIEAVREHLFPPRITYQKVQEAAAENPDAGLTWNIFAALLPGLAAMFLLFMADNAVRDLYREQRFRTFDRFRTLRSGLLVFVGSKVLFALVILWIGGAILFGGGALIFGIHWAHPAALGVLVAAYTLFAAGFMALVSALAGTEKRADTLNTTTAMALGLAGGCMFPPNQLPAALRDHVTPLMPTHWFATAAKELQFSGHPSWAGTALLLAAMGLVLVVAAAWRLQRRLEQGGPG